MTRAEDALRAELEERLRFEALLADLSARFVHVPADQVDGLIEEAQRRIVQALGLDRSTLLQRADTEDDLVVTHAWAVPEFVREARALCQTGLPVGASDAPPGRDRALRDAGGAARRRPRATRSPSARSNRSPR